MRADAKLLSRRKSNAQNLSRRKRLPLKTRGPRSMGTELITISSWGGVYRAILERRTRTKSDSRNRGETGTKLEKALGRGLELGLT